MRSSMQEIKAVTFEFHNTLDKSDIGRWPSDGDMRDPVDAYTFTLVCCQAYLLQVVCLLQGCMICLVEIIQGSVCPPWLDLL